MCILWVGGDTTFRTFQERVWVVISWRGWRWSGVSGVGGPRLQLHKQTVLIMIGLGETWRVSGVLYKGISLLLYYYYKFWWWYKENRSTRLKDRTPARSRAETLYFWPYPEKELWTNRYSAMKGMCEFRGGEGRDWMKAERKVHALTICFQLLSDTES